MRARSEAPARILEAAIAVIEDGGEVAIRVHDLAGACGVTVGSDLGPPNDGMTIVWVS